MTRAEDSTNAATVTVDGRRIELLDLPGDPSRAPLVLLHEGLGSVRLWRSFPHELAAATGARVVAFSRFGHGASDPPARPRTPRFMNEEALEVLPQVLQATEASGPLLVGHSDGASIALIHAAAHPVRAAVAIAPHVFVEEVGIAEIRRAREAYLHGGLRERMARHHRNPDAAFFGWNDVWLDPEFAAWNIEDELAQIEAPVLLIQGENDQYGTMAQLDTIERAVRGPVERVHLRCAHAPHLEAPAETVAAITRFVARRGRRPGRR